MSYNGSGVYTPPAGQPVTAGTVILASTFNTLVTDISNTFNNVITRDGQGVPTAAIKFVDGTITIPGISFNSEASTGLYRPGSGLMANTVSGVEVIRYKSNGAVMIGSSTDTGEKLQVTGTAKITGALAVGGALSGVTDLTTTGNTILGDAQSDTLNVGNGDIIKDASGNVGFGTNPAVKLHALGTTPTLRLETNSAAGTAYSRFQLSTVSGTGLDLLNYGSGYSGGTVFGVGPNGAGIFQNLNAPLALGTQGVAQPLYLGTNSTTRITIAGAGNVTIGQPTAGSALTINNLRGTMFDTGTAAGPAWRIQATATYNSYMGIYEASQTNGWWLGKINGASGALLLGVGSSEGAGTTVITVSQAGNVSLSAPTSGASLALSQASNAVGLALNATSRSWVAGTSAIQYGGFGSIWCGSNGGAFFGFGLYEGGTNTYNYLTTGDPVSVYRAISGTHKFLNAVAGTSGNAVTLVESLAITAAGNVTIAAPTSGYTMTVNGSSPISVVAPAATGMAVMVGTGSTTGLQYADFINTGGILRWGVQGSAANSLVSGATAYAAVIGAHAATDFCIGTNAIVRLNISAAGAVTMPVQIGFRATASAQQNAASNTEATTYGATAYNVGSYFNATTGRFTPGVAGKYLVTAYGACNTTGSSSHQGITICKNGSGTVLSSSDSFVAGTDSTTRSVTALIDLNGSTDYVSMFISNSVATSSNVISVFSAQLLS